MPPLPRHRAALAALALLVWTPIAAEAACSEVVPASAIQDALGRAEQALVDLDIPTFKQEVGQAEQLLPCVGERMAPPLVASFHRFWGLRAFGERDPLAKRSFAAARHIEPAYRFSETLVPTGNPILSEYVAIDPKHRSTVPVPPPARGHLLFDGTEGLDRPSDWPVVVQHVDPDGVQFTAYLRPDSAMPAYALAVDAVVEPPVAQGSTLDLRRPLLVGTGSAVLMTSVLYGLALRGKARFHDVDRNPVPDGDLAGLRARTNGLVVASAITASLAVGGGVTLAMTW